MARPNFEKLEKQFERGDDFELTNQQYKSRTGTDFPKDKSYAERKSAVARKAGEYGYQIVVIPQKILFKKGK